jgi:hypothetical protein
MSPDPTSAANVFMKATTPIRETLDRGNIGKRCRTFDDVEASIRPHF